MNMKRYELQRRCLGEWITVISWDSFAPLLVVKTSDHRIIDTVTKEVLQV